MALGWKEVERGEGLDVVFGFSVLKPPSPTPLPRGLLKIYPATSIVPKTISN